MTMLENAVEKLQETICDSGCADGAVTIRRFPDGPKCPYLHGVVIGAEYGGRHTAITTEYPLQARTLVSFMFGRALRTPEQRTAAIAIINGVMGFLCMARALNACTPPDHAPCLAGLQRELAGMTVYFNGSMPGLERNPGTATAADPERADIILVSGDGLATDEGLAVVDKWLGTKKILLIGPETTGIATVMKLDHWCPYGRL